MICNLQKKVGLKDTILTKKIYMNLLNQKKKLIIFNIFNRLNNIMMLKK